MRKSVFQEALKTQYKPFMQPQTTPKKKFHIKTKNIVMTLSIIMIIGGVIALPIALFYYGYPITSILVTIFIGYRMMVALD